MPGRTDNPAGRLHALLQELQSQPDPNRVTAVTAWSNVLGVQAQRSEVFPRYVAVVSLIDRIEELVAALDYEDTAHFVSEMPQLRGVLTDLSLLGQPVAQTTGAILPQAMVQLQMTSQILSQRWGEPPVTADDSQLDEIRDEISQLLKEVEDASDVEAELKLFLVEHLREMAYAVSNVKILGNEGLRRAVNTSLGDAIVGATNQETGTSRSLAERFWKLAGRLATVGTLALMPLNVNNALEHHVLPAPASHIIVATAELGPGPPLGDS